ncbi:hypothetical protein [Zhihengliuella flava]|uniref:Sec-independent protein translocase protein TatA n=1 Tax=Zhihengliuella flava TaxID=1285193 RepID=A0A931D9D3_9MICC|nr:hypothetical protein [Zhihengliuella flava]MBG6083246.1 Sec-independent protein translocase protein TatA [Zhihengliuella flava]
MTSHSTPARTHPLCEPVPYYMSAIGMQGARFVEGNPGGAPDPAPKSNEGGNGDDPASKGEGEPKPNEGDGDGNEKLGEAGQKALKAERAAKKKAEADLKALQDRYDQLTEKDLSEKEKAEKRAKEASERAEQLERENWRLAALAKHPVPEDYQDLVVGQDAESFLSSAERISKLVKTQKGGSDPVPGSGTRRNGDKPGSGSLMDSGRDRYTSRYSRNKKQAD